MLKLHCLTAAIVTPDSSVGKASREQDNSAQNQLGPRCKTRPMPTRPNLNFINIQLIPHFRRIESCDCKIRPFMLEIMSETYMRVHVEAYMRVSLSFSHENEIIWSHRRDNSGSEFLERNFLIQPRVVRTF